MEWCRPLALVLLVASSGCQTPLQRFEFDEAHMGSPMRIVVYAADAEKAHTGSAAAFARIAAIERALSDYDPGSEVSQLGARTEESVPTDWIPVGIDLDTVLRASHRVWHLSEGAFDPTVGSATRLWRRSVRQQALPSEERIQAALEGIGLDQIEQHPQRPAVRLHRQGLRLDFGGIAKGYAADEAARALQRAGIDRYLLDVGGDLLAGQPPPDRAGWSVALEAPDRPDLLAVRLSLSNAAVATSGSTYRYVEIDGVRYSHLIDPTTGLGLTELRQVNVTGPDAMFADAWASALSILPRDDALRMIESLAGFEARLSWAENNQIMEVRSSGFPDLEPVPSATDDGLQSASHDSTR